MFASLALLVLAVGAGCGEDDEQASASGNATDRAFARAMIPHHEGAVEMGELAKQEAEHRELESLAEDIIAGQNAEIRTLRRVERDLASKGVGRGDLGLDAHMMGMDHDVHGLDSAREFDRAFIDMMVPHHRGAIRMAQIELKRGENPTLRRLAHDIIETQNREIREMGRWRKEWFGSAGSGAHEQEKSDHSTMGGH